MCLQIGIFLPLFPYDLSEEMPGISAFGYFMTSLLRLITGIRGIEVQRNIANVFVLPLAMRTPSNRHFSSFLPIRVQENAGIFGHFRLL